MDSKRKKIETLILKTVNLADPSGYNDKIYKEMFASMDDKAFDSYMHTLRNDHNAKLTLITIPLKVIITVENAFKAAHFLGIKVLERLRLWDPVAKRYCLTTEKYFILRLPVRRLKQYLMDGLSVPNDDKRLNPLTDQVTGPSKGSAISFPQAQMIAEKGLTTTLQELMTIRGGDLTAYARMKSEIEETGMSDTSVMQDTEGVRSAQTLNTFLNAMHLDANI